MKKSSCILILLLFGGFLAFGQGKGAKEITTKLKGTAINAEGKSLYLHHRWEGKDFSDSTKISGGKFQFNIRSKEPNLFWITTTPDINTQPNLSFFVDQAPLSATVNVDSLPNSVVNGGKAQSDFREYANMIQGFVQVQLKMQADFNEAAQKGDVATQEAIRAEYGNLNTQFLAGLKNFIKTHPASPVSGYIVYNDLGNPAIPVEELEEALSYTDKSIANTTFVKLARKRVNDVRGTTVGYTANDFTQNTPEGKPVKLSDFRGQMVLIDFWASWCRPCRMENPNVVAAYQRYKDKGFTVLGVSLDSKREPWLAAIQQDQLSWTNVSDLKGWGNEVAKMYGVTGIPQNYLVDKDGKILAKNLRGADLDQKLAEVLDKDPKTVR